MFIYIITFLIAFLGTFIITPLIRKIALKYKIVDYPDTAVKTHRQPVAYLGGLTIYFGFIISMLILSLTPFFSSFPLKSLVGILIGGTLIMLLGLYDDLMGLSFTTKFFWQIVAAIILIFFDVRIQFISPSYISIFFTLLWVVGITNAFNIIDIMDGLSCGVAVIASLALCFITLPTEQFYVNFASLALAGSGIAFLNYNLRLGNIFMGDTGSLFIGFILASISMGTSYTKINNIALFAPLLILGLPIYDTILVMYFRFRQGKPIFKGSLDHFALRMEKLGLSRRQVVLLSYLYTILLSSAALFSTRVDIIKSVLTYIFIGGIFIIGAVYLGKIKMER